jgi:hypothetical protein
VIHWRSFSAVWLPTDFRLHEAIRRTSHGARRLEEFGFQRRMGDSIIIPFFRLVGRKMTDKGKESLAYASPTEPHIGLA